MKEKYIDSAQNCNQCGMPFLIRVFANGSYEYLSDTCKCESDFAPAPGELSISEIVETLQPLSEDKEDEVEWFDLYPRDKNVPCFAFYWYENNERYEAQVKAKSLNEAIGCFLVEHPDMSFNDIYDVCEI